MANENVGEHGAVATTEADGRESHNFTLGGKTYTRKKRRPLSRMKKERLEEAFQRKEVPRGRHGSSAKKRLAKELDMSVKEVHKWFDNRRTKESTLEKRLFSRMMGSVQEMAKDKRLINQHLGVASPRPKSVMTIPVLAGTSGSKRRKITSRNIPSLWDGNVNVTKPVGSVVAAQFRVIDCYFAGKLNLRTIAREYTLEDLVQDVALQTPSHHHAHTTVHGQLPHVQRGQHPLDPPTASHAPSGQHLHVPNHSRTHNRHTNVHDIAQAVGKHAHRHDQEELLRNHHPTASVLLREKQHEEIMQQRMQPRKRKPRVQPTLQNVVEVAFSKDSCFYPLVEAIQVIASAGHLEALIRRVLHEPTRNLRTFLMWYAIGKHSGDRTVGAVVRSFMQGLSPALLRLSLAQVLAAQIPELIDGGLHRAAAAASGRYTLFGNDGTNDISLSQSDSSSKWMGELINDVFLGKTIHMKGSSISWLRDGEKDNMLAGEITKVLPPTPRYPQEPMFRVYFPEIDVAKTYTWKQLKASTPNLDLIGKSTTVAQHLE